jgi:uncharacterized protein YerC
MNDNKVKTGAWKEIQLDFHNFTVIEELGMRFPTEKSKNKKRYIRVKCKLCALEYEGQYSLFKNRDKVCKCESRKGKGVIAWSNPNRDRILNIRRGMIYRCHNKKCARYKDYGEKGIKVCDEWLNSAELFHQWALNNGYVDGLTIERIDNNKGYEPDNCTWITRAKQNMNRTHTLSVEKVKEVKKLLQEKVRHKKIASMMGVSVLSISRLSCGMTWANID